MDFGFRVQVYPTIACGSDSYPKHRAHSERCRALYLFLEGTTLYVRVPSVKFQGSSVQRI